MSMNSEDEIPPIRVCSYPNCTAIVLNVYQHELDYHSNDHPVEGVRILNAANIREETKIFFKKRKFINKYKMKSGQQGNEKEELASESPTTKFGSGAMERIKAKETSSSPNRDNGKNLSQSSMVNLINSLRTSSKLKNKSTGSSLSPKVNKKGKSLLSKFYKTGSKKVDDCDNSISSQDTNKYEEKNSKEKRKRKNSEKISLQDACEQEFSSSQGQGDTFERGNRSKKLRHTEVHSSSLQVNEVSNSTNNVMYEETSLAKKIKAERFHYEVKEAEKTNKALISEMQDKPLYNRADEGFIPNETFERLSNGNPKKIHCKSKDKSNSTTGMSKTELFNSKMKEKSLSNAKQKSVRETKDELSNNRLNEKLIGKTKEQSGEKVKLKVDMFSSLEENAEHFCEAKRVRVGVKEEPSFIGSLFKNMEEKMVLVKTTDSMKKRNKISKDKIKKKAPDEAAQTGNVRSSKISSDSHIISVEPSSNEVISVGVKQEKISPSKSNEMGTNRFMNSKPDDKSKIMKNKTESSNEDIALQEMNKNRNKMIKLEKNCYTERAIKVELITLDDKDEEIIEIAKSPHENDYDQLISEFILSDNIMSELCKCKKEESSTSNIPISTCNNIQKIVLVILYLKIFDIESLMSLRVCELMCQKKDGDDIILDISCRKGAKTIRMKKFHYKHIELFITAVRPRISINPYGVVFTDTMQKPLTYDAIKELIEAGWSRSDINEDISKFMRRKA